MAGDVSFKEEKVFKNLLIFSSVRGMDSTGAGSVTRHPKNGKRDMSLAKEIGPFPYLFDRKAFDKLFHGVNHCYIGHNRSRTVGEITRANAHPFMFEDILGAHNGTVAYQDKNRMEDGSSFKTDSEALIWNIQCNGIEDTIGKIEDTEAYALTWYDRRDNSINLLRNDKRPLLYCTANSGRTIFWSSEYGILSAAIYREDLKIDDKVWSLSPNTLYSFVIPDAMSEKMPAPKRKLLRNFTRTVQSNLWNRNGWIPSHNMGNHFGFRDNMNDSLDNLKDDDDMVDGGHFVGKVSKPGFNVVDMVAEAAKTVTEGKAKLAEKFNVMSAADVIKKQAFERAQKAETVPKTGVIAQGQKGPMVIQIFDGPNLKVYRNVQSGMWSYMEWNSTREEWDRHDSAMHPKDMPFTILDIEARHVFKHRGKGKRKEIFYRGFKGSLLNQEIFGSKMKSGCMNCSRIPEWGNEVCFVSEDHDFLCEYCAMTPELATSFIAMNVKSKNVAA